MYTCENATLFEILCTDSFSFFSNTMSSQEQLQLTEEAVMMRGLSGVHSEVALLLWASRHDQLLHPLVQTRLSEIRSTQMTSVDESIMYHVKSFTKEPVTLNPTKMNSTTLSPRNSKDPRHPSPQKFVPSSKIVIDQPTLAQTPLASPRAHEGISNVETATDERIEAQRSSPSPL